MDKETNTLACISCDQAHDNSFVTLDIVDHNDLVKRQESIGPFCTRCSGNIFRTLKPSLQKAPDAQRRAISVELQRQRLQERGITVASKEGRRELREAPTPFDHTQ